jgi:hypothetical protein
MRSHIAQFLALVWIGLWFWRPEVSAIAIANIWILGSMVLRELEERK